MTVVPESLWCQEASTIHVTMHHSNAIVRRRSTRDLAKIVETRPKGYDASFLRQAASELQRRRRARWLLAALLGAAGLAAAALWFATGNKVLTIVVLIAVPLSGILSWLMGAIPDGDPAHGEEFDNEPARDEETRD